MTENLFLNAPWTEKKKKKGRERFCKGWMEERRVGADWLGEWVFGAFREVERYDGLCDGKYFL